MATILLAATATPGHVNPMLAAARLLVAQGHRVLMLCGALFEQRIRATGAEFVPFAPEVDFDYRALERHFPERASLSGTPRWRWRSNASSPPPWRSTTGSCGR